MTAKNDRRLLLSTVLVGVGVIVGWWSRKVFVDNEVKNTEQAIAISRAANVTTKAARKDNPGEKEERSGKAGDPMIERLQALAWMKRNLQGRVGIMVISGNRLDEQFIKTFDLTESETTILNDQLTRAKSNLEQISIAAATCKLDSEKNLFSVHIPPLPTEGGQIRDQLIQSFAEVLGPERYQDMIALVGQGFDSSFREFGLGDTTYEINLVPSLQNGVQAVYAVKENTLYPGGGTSVGNSTVFPSTISESFPVLGHFIPSNVFVPSK